MTQAETRKLGIEFERRLQIMYPNSKFTEKLTSDTIYSILNEFLIKYIKQLYLALRLQKLGEIGAENVDNVLRALCNTEEDILVENDMFDVPTDYWLYLRSSSSALIKNSVDDDSNDENDNQADLSSVDEEQVDLNPINDNLDGEDNSNDETISGKEVTLSNELIEDKDANKVISKYENYAGILRHPLIVVQGDKFKILHDIYTDIQKVHLVYYKTPSIFDVSNTPCDLPVSAFDDLVSGAIKLYVYEYKFALAMSASNSKYNKLKKGIDKLAEDNKQEQ